MLLLALTYRNPSREQLSCDLNQPPALCFLRSQLFISFSAGLQQPVFTLQPPESVVSFSHVDFGRRPPWPPAFVCSGCGGDPALIWILVAKIYLHGWFLDPTVHKHSCQGTFKGIYIVNMPQ